MRFMDLFAGIGGFHYGLEQANKNRETPKGLLVSPKQHNGNIGKHDLQATTFNCVWANEWDKYAGKVYQARFPNTPFSSTDIKLVSPNDIPEADLLCAGFPCQTFSLAGKRKGFEEARGTLFYEICRIAKAKRIPYLLLENVKGLLSAQDSFAFYEILHCLDELGYVCQWEVLNSKNFGVPQNRERVFIVGCLGEKRFKQIFPLSQSNEILGKKATRKQVANALTATYWKGVDTYGGRTMIELTKNQPQGQRIYDVKGVSQTISSGGGGLGAKTGLYKIPQTAQALQTDGMLYQGSSWGTNNPESSRAIRRLTPTECERLQGYPNGWTAIEGMSETQRYKMLGNAVTTKVITAIGEKLSLFS